MVCFNGLLQRFGSRMKTEENSRKPKENKSPPGGGRVFLRFSEVFRGFHPTTRPLKQTIKADRQECLDSTAWVETEKSEET